MEHIGKYKNRHCYLITQDEYLKERFYDNKDSIFIIERSGEMVYQNKRIGNYDGRRVKDYDEPFEIFSQTAEYLKKYTEIKKKERVAEEPRVEVEVEDKLAPQIDFKDYDKEVDRFFEEYNKLSNEFISLMASV